MLFYHLSEETNQQYIKSIIKGKEKLKGESRSFVDALLTKDSVSTENTDDILSVLEAEGEDSFDDDISRDALKSYFEKHLRNSQLIGVSTFFPKEFYPALDLLMGKAMREKYLEACQKIHQFPYTLGYYRRPVRSENLKYHMDALVAMLFDFMEIYASGAELSKLMTNGYAQDEENLKYITYENLLFVEIDRGNQDIIRLCQDILGGGRGSDMSYEVIRGILKSDNTSLHQLTADLLLAAKLQEGLRQVICENIDCSTTKVFHFFFELIYEKDLFRFASVKRALATWTGIGEYYADRIGKKELQLIHQVLRDPNQADAFLNSKDNIELYIGLWYKGNHRVEDAIAEIEKILKSGERNQKLLASFYLNAIQASELRGKIAMQVIADYHQDMEMMACYENSFLEDYRPWNWEEKQKQGLLTSEVLFPNAKNSKKEAKNEVIKYFYLLKDTLDGMTEKKVLFSPCIFPWYSAELTKEALAAKMGLLAIAEKQTLLEDMCDYLKFVNSYHRETYIRLLLSLPVSSKQKDTLIHFLGTGSNREAFRIIEEQNLEREYIPQLQKMLRLKSGDVRQHVIRLLFRQEDAVLSAAIEELLSDKDVNKRLGGLDLLLKTMSDRPKLFSKVKLLTKKIKAPTSAETVLIQQIEASGKKNAKSPASTLSYDKAYAAPEMKLPKLKKTTADIFTLKEKDYVKLYEKLNSLYIEYHDYEYLPVYGDEITLAAGFRQLKELNGSTIDSSEEQEAPIPETYSEKQNNIYNYPLAELWLKFYEENIKDFSSLYQLFMIQNLVSGHWYMNDSSFEKFHPKLIGFDHRPILKKLEKIKYYENYSLKQIISLLYHKYAKENRKFLAETAMVLLRSIYDNFSLEDMKIPSPGYGKGDDFCTILSLNLIHTALESLKSYPSDDEEFKNIFALKYELYRKMKFGSKGEHFDGDIHFIYLDEFQRAVELDLLAKDEFYIEILDRDKLSTYMPAISRYAYDIGSYRADDLFEEITNYRNFWNLRLSFSDSAFTKKGLSSTYMKELAKDCTLLMEHILTTELNRGDTPTLYSDAILQVYRIRGAENLVRIITALGNEKLDRGTYYWNTTSTNKKMSLSHLLKVCHPAKNDDANKLNKLLKPFDISVERLVEVAMYASAWVDILEDYLGWRGFAGGCYYFMAHMSDVDRQKEALFAKYTPIPLEDLAMGAFDIDWFKTSYQQLGEQRFNILYEAAKYISDGAKHSRARMFADAVNGNILLPDAENKINDKRNKDMVASYGLIPLAKNKTKDLVKRYKFLQKFLKESKQFGAQRRASEAKATEIALENLARNAGYSDVTRLTWSMETELIEEIQSYFRPKKIGDIEVFLRIDALGQSSIVYQKDGKELKSLPAKLKKVQDIAEIKQIHNNLKEQYRRSRRMLEQAMEDQVEFLPAEIQNLMKNPVIAPIIQVLVLKSKEKLGYYVEGQLVSPTGAAYDLASKQPVTIAHPLDFYHEGSWTAYQKDLFEKQIKQPFKQVFRELYVKTADELGKSHSLRYAGHQIQPSKTVAVLKSRRWIAEYEEGLQKVYYRQNIIAKIYALADWFSPAEIEAPTLEWVEFTDRKTFQPIQIDDIPDIIFSEVMRDVDLAVSVAHAGEVDPQASHSTVELRKALVKFNAELFRLQNIQFTENHALIAGKLGEFTVHLGSGVIHQKAGPQIHVLPIHSQHKGRLFLPFIDEDPKTAEILSKIILFEEDSTIKDPFILNQIQRS